MSDDLVKRAAALVEKEKAWDEWEYPSQPAPPAMVQGEVATLVSDMAAEITRLRAWRDAINGYLTEAWNSPLRDDEAPLAALKRLIKLELTAMALDPEMIKAINAAIATARREGLEEAAQRLEELHKNHKYDSKTGEVRWRGKLVKCQLTINCALGYWRAITEGAAHIRAAAREGKP